MKILLYFCISTVLFFAAGSLSFASDYQYKILDPKYNPQAKEIIKGNIPPIEEAVLPVKKKSFDFGLLFSILLLVSFPVVIVTTAAKAYKKLFDDVPGRDNTQSIGNVKIEKKSVSSKNKNSSDSHKKPNYKADIRPATSTVPPNKKIPQNTGNSINKYFSSPIQKIKNPMLLNTSVLTVNKGLCLVEYNKKYSLIGYINSEIFLLNQFNSINGIEIRARLSETVGEKDRYIVRLGDFKALVEVTDSNMQMLLEL